MTSKVSTYPQIWCIECGKRIKSPNHTSFANAKVSCIKCQLRIKTQNRIRITQESRCSSFVGDCIVEDESMICIACNTEGHLGSLMKMHLCGPYCCECHLIVIKEPPSERESQRVVNDEALYDLDGHRLCDIRQCYTYGAKLNNVYKGFFCNAHYRYMRELRNTIKTHPSTFIEYDARMQEIAIRKNSSPHHIEYAATLRTWLLNLSTILGLHEIHYIAFEGGTPDESIYINSLFSTSTLDS